MVDHKNPEHSDELSEANEFGDSVQRKSERMLAHRHQRVRSPWFGLGFFGLIGWSVTVPTLLGICLGSVLDDRFTGPPSWTLTCMLAGLTLGCINAAYWISTENARHKNQQNGKPDER